LPVCLIFQPDGLSSSTKSLVQTLNSAKIDPAVEVVIAPPAIYLLLVQEHLTNTQVKVAAQNVFDKAQGAFTGEISYSVIVVPPELIL
jgi:triosephosphate isomerase